MRRSSSQLQHKLTLTSGELEELKQTTRVAQESLTEKARQLEEMKADLEQVRTLLEDILSAKPAATTTEKPPANIDVVQRVKALLADMTGQKEELETLKTKLQSQTEANAQLAQSLSSSQEEFDNIKQTLTTTETELARVSKSLETTEAAIETLEDKFPDLTKPGGALPERVAQLEGKAQELQEKQKTLTRSQTEAEQFRKELKKLIQPITPATEPSDEAAPLPLEKPLLEQVKDLVTELSRSKETTLADRVQASAARELEQLKTDTAALQEQVGAVSKLVEQSEHQRFPSEDRSALELTQRVRELLQIPEESQMQSLSEETQALGQTLKVIRETLRSVFSDDDRGIDTVGQVKKLVNDHLRLTEEHSKKVEEHDSLQAHFRQVGSEAEELQGKIHSLEEQLEKLSEESHIARQTLEQTDAAVKAFEDDHQAEYKPGPDDDLPTRLKKLMGYAAQTERTRTEADPLQSEYQQNKASLDDIAEAVNQALPDEPGGARDTAPKTPVEKIHQLSQEKAAKEQEVAKLAQKVENLEKGYQLAETTGQLRAELAQLKEQQSRAEDDLQKTRTERDAVKEQLKQWEESQGVKPIDENDIVSRAKILTDKLQSMETEVSAAQTRLQQLTDSQMHVKTLLEAPVHIHPADLAEGMPGQAQYELLVQVAGKYPVRSDELLVKLQQIEMMVEAFAKDTSGTDSHLGLLNKIKDNLPGDVETFWDSTEGKVFSDSGFSEFAQKTGLTRQQAAPLLSTLSSIGPQDWAELLDDVLLMKNQGVSPAAVALPHLTMAKSGTPFARLQAVFNAAVGVNDYESLYTRLEAESWLRHVDHPIPLPEVLETFPAPKLVVTITLDEFNTLRKFLQRHNVQPESFPVLADKLQKSVQWVSLSDGSTEIDQPTFDHLKSAIAGSPTGGTVDELAIQIKAPGQAAALQALISLTDSLPELDTLLEGAQQLGQMVQAGKVIPETLNMVFHGTPPAVVRMARVAAEGAPDYYQQRYKELQLQTIKRQAMAVLNTPEAKGILAGDDPADLLDAMSDPGSGIYKALKAVPEHLPANNPDDIRVIHQHLSLVSLLITGDDSVDIPVLSGLEKTLGEAGKFVNSEAGITGQSLFDEVLQANGLSEHKALVVQICNSGITPVTIRSYIEQAVAIRKHHPRMVSCGILQAAYEPEWTAEQFRLVKVLANSPKVRILAKDAHTGSGLRDLTSQMQELEAASETFGQLVGKLAELDQEKVRLSARFSRLKTNYHDIELNDQHPGDDPSGGIVKIAGNIKDAASFDELRTATGEFSQHPRVAVARELVPMLEEIESTMEQLPTPDELEALEEFDTKYIQTKASQWVTSSDGSPVRRDELLPYMKALAGTDAGEEYLDFPVVVDEYVKIFGSSDAPEIATEEATPSSSQPVLQVVDVQEKMEELYQMQIKAQLEPGDFDRAKELAQHLSDDSWKYPLELWVGEQPKALLKHLAQLQAAADDGAIKGRLDELFKPGKILNSRRLNIHLQGMIHELKKARPHVAVYEKAAAQFGFASEPAEDSGPTRLRAQIYPGALQETLEAVAGVVDKNKEHIDPELVAKAPKPASQGSSADPELTASEVSKSAIRLLSAKQEVDALKELKTASNLVNDLEALRADETGDTDIDPAFTRECQQVIDELEGYCKTCAAQKWLPRGALEDLHENGEIRSAKVQQAKKLFEDEIRHRKSTQTSLEQGSSQLGEGMITHTRVLSVLSDMAEEVIPEEFRSVILLLRDIHAENPGAINKLQNMHEERVLRLGGLSQSVRDKFAQRPEWQLLIDFISGENIVGELSKDVRLADIVDTDPVSQLRLSKTVAANMAASKQLEIQLRKSLDLLTLLDNDDERQAALFLKKAQAEAGLDLGERPAYPEVVVQKLKSVYGEKLPDSEATVMAGVIYRGLSVSPDSWDKVTNAVAKMPKAGPEMFSGTTNQIMNMNLQMAQSLLDINEAFHRWILTDKLPQKMVVAVHNLQLRVEDIEAVRTYQRLYEEKLKDPAAFKAAEKVIPQYPKAAHLLQLTEEDMHRLAELPERQWQRSVIDIANDPGKKSAKFAVSQTLRNSVDVTTRFILEFILDDVNLYGGTGTIAVLLGYADSTLRWLGIDRESFIRAALHAYSNNLFNPRFQKFAARWVTPVTSGVQIVRVIRDVHTYVSPGDVSATAGALRSLSFFLLAELNDLTWGGELTKRMALAFRGMDMLVDVQIILEDRIKRTRNRYARGKITKLEMQHLIKQDLASIELLAKGGDNWREDCKAVVETLRGDDGITDADIDYYIDYINSSYSYQNIKKTWEEGVATVSAVLSKGRPFMTPFTSSLPKYMILAGVVDPMVRYGLNAAAAPGVAGALGKVSSTLLGTSLQIGSYTLPPAVIGTAAVMAGTTMYDGIYNNFEQTRQTWYPFARFVDEMSGIDFEKASDTGSRTACLLVFHFEQYVAMAVDVGS